MHIGYGVVSVWRRSLNNSVSDAFQSEWKELFPHITYIVSDLGNRWWDLALIIIRRIAYCFVRIRNRWDTFEAKLLRLGVNWFDFGDGVAWVILSFVLFEVQFWIYHNWPIAGWSSRLTDNFCISQWVHTDIMDPNLCIELFINSIAADYYY